MRLRSIVPFVVAWVAVAPVRAADDDVSIFSGGLSARFGDIHLRLGYQRYRSRYFSSYFYPVPVYGWVGFVPPVYCPPPVPPPPFCPPSFVGAPVIVLFDHDRTAPPAAPTGSAIERLRRDVEVTLRDSGRCHLRWRESPAGVRRVEYEVVDRDRKPLTVRAVEEPPYAAEIELPEGAAALVVTAFYRDGSSVAVRVPLVALRPSED